MVAVCTICTTKCIKPRLPWQYLANPRLLPPGRAKGAEFGIVVCKLLSTWGFQVRQRCTCTFVYCTPPTWFHQPIAPSPLIPLIRCNLLICVEKKQETWLSEWQLIGKGKGAKGLWNPCEPAPESNHASAADGWGGKWDVSLHWTELSIRDQPWMLCAVLVSFEKGCSYCGGKAVNVHQPDS